MFASFRLLDNHEMFLKKITTIVLGLFLWLIPAISQAQPMIFY